MTRYEKGFIEKCAEYGVDPRALVKSSMAGTGRSLPPRLRSIYKRIYNFFNPEEVYERASTLSNALTRKTVTREEAELLRNLGEQARTVSREVKGHGSNFQAANEATGRLNALIERAASIRRDVDKRARDRVARSMVPHFLRRVNGNRPLTLAEARSHTRYPLSVEAV